MAHLEQSACGKSCLRISELIEGDAKGSMLSIDLPLTGTIDTYVSCPPGETLDSLKGSGKAKKVLLWCCDVYGPNFKNQQLLMDWHASNGYLVLAPDYFHGEQLERLKTAADFDNKAWIGKWRVPVKDAEGNEMNMTDLCLKEWLPIVKGMFGGKDTKYAMIGFCFGAPYVVHYASTDEISAAAIVHPAFLADDEAFKKIKQPFYASLAEQDAHFPPPRREALLSTLTSLSTPEAPDGDSADVSGSADVEFMVQVFGGVMHGWALRGDTKIPKVAWAKKKSAEECSEWFDRFCN